MRLDPPLRGLTLHVPPAIMSASIAEGFNVLRVSTWEFQNNLRRRALGKVPLRNLINVPIRVLYPGRYVSFRK